MPVVNILKTRIKSIFPNKNIEKILVKLPFLGLDIEGIDEDKIRVEYNPNRPDFSSDTGIFRSLKGLLNETVGLPIFRYSNDKLYEITIGIHDLNTIEFPLTYNTSGQQASFIPLDQTKPFKFKEILSDLAVGKKYSSLLRNLHRYPTIADRKNQIVSFPPIINSNNTKINDKSNNLLIEITGTNLETCKSILAIIAYYLYDEGYEICSGIIHDHKSTFSSLKLLKDNTISVDTNIIKRYLGLNLSTKEIRQILNRCRLGVSITNNKKVKCLIPPYRTDISNS